MWEVEEREIGTEGNSEVVKGYYMKDRIFSLAVSLSGTLRLRGGISPFEEVSSS
jgi:hypothetical protein